MKEALKRVRTDPVVESLSSAIRAGGSVVHSETGPQDRASASSESRPSEPAPGRGPLPRHRANKASAPWKRDPASTGSSAKKRRKKFNRGAFGRVWQQARVDLEVARRNPAIDAAAEAVTESDSDSMHLPFLRL